MVALVGLAGAALAAAGSFEASARTSRFQVGRFGICYPERGAQRISRFN
jgi:hypothetical protein